MDNNTSIIEFLSQEQFQQKAEAMVVGMKLESKQLNRPVYFSDGQFCYEQWPDGRKYVLLTDAVTVTNQ